jgi:alpha-galactosidase
MPYSRIKLQGLDPDKLYKNVLANTESYGDELMNLGLITTDVTAGQVSGDTKPCTDFESRIYILQEKS